MNQLFAFLSIGAVLNAGAIAVFYVLVDQLGVNDYVVITLLFFCTTRLSFLLNRRFSFSGSQKSAYLKFFMTYCLALVLQMFIVALGNAYNVNPTLAYACSIVLSALVNFLLIKVFVFTNG